jgi:hypothetical protein
MSDITIVYQNDLSADPIIECVGHMKRSGLAVEVDAVEPFGPVAGIEWLMPTAVVVLLAKPYFDGFLKEAGKDHYVALKEGLVGLWSRYLSPDKTVRFMIVGTPGKVDLAQPHSHLFSIYTPTKAGSRIKFLFDHTCSREVFLDYLDAVHRAMKAYHSEDPASVIAKVLVGRERAGFTMLVRFNSNTGELEPFEPFLGKLLESG